MPVKRKPKVVVVTVFPILNAYAYKLTFTTANSGSAVLSEFVLCPSARIVLPLLAVAQHCYKSGNFLIFSREKSFSTRVRPLASSTSLNPPQCCGVLNAAVNSSAIAIHSFIETVKQQLINRS